MKHAAGTGEEAISSSLKHCGRTTSEICATVMIGAEDGSVCGRDERRVMASPLRPPGLLDFRVAMLEHEVP